MPAVTIVVPCYNGARFITACIDSVQRQTQTDWSLVLVDDCSNDDSATVADGFAAADPRVSVVRIPQNVGVAAARNVGARYAGTPYVMFLDVDDMLAPTMLQVTTDYLEGHPQVPVVFTGHSYIGPNGEFLGVEHGQWPWARYVATRLGVKCIPSSSAPTPFSSIFLIAAVIPSLAMIRRSAFTKTPGWDESFGQGCEDTDLFLELALQGDFHYLPQPLVYYRQHPAQDTRSGRFQQQYDRLHKKWTTRDDLDDEQREIVTAAEWFRRRRFIPSRHLIAAGHHMRAGHPLKAIRAAASAARLYSPRRPSASVSLHT
jgi:glycosyltransferase involved in cell wall biosynthesis